MFPIVLRYVYGNYNDIIHVSSVNIYKCDNVREHADCKLMTLMATLCRSYEDTCLIYIIFVVYCLF